MQIDELLQFVDDTVYLNTGQHLNDLQRAVIEGSLKREKYAEIADNFNCTAGHAKDIGYELFQLLSEIFDEPVDKSNIQSVLERQVKMSISLSDTSLSSNIIQCLKICFKNHYHELHQQDSTHSKFTRRKKKNQIETIDKLRYFGLSDDQIAEVLDLPLEVVKQVKID